MFQLGKEAVLVNENGNIAGVELIDDKQFDICVRKAANRISVPNNSWQMVERGISIGPIKTLPCLACFADMQDAGILVGHFVGFRDDRDVKAIKLERPALESLMQFSQSSEELVDGIADPRDYPEYQSGLSLMQSFYREHVLQYRDYLARVRDYNSQIKMIYLLGQSSLNSVNNGREDAALALMQKLDQIQVLTDMNRILGRDRISDNRSGNGLEKRVKSFFSAEDRKIYFTESADNPDS